MQRYVVGGGGVTMAWWYDRRCGFHVKTWGCSGSIQWQTFQTSPLACQINKSTTSSITCKNGRPIQKPQCDPRSTTLYRPSNRRQQASRLLASGHQRRLTGRSSLRTAASDLQHAAASLTSSSSPAPNPNPSTSCTPPAMRPKAKTRASA
jgi:hypothetical protein